MKILVTGANGMLGRDLCPILEDEGFDVIETDTHNMDITDYQQIEKMLKQEHPDFIVHCAAYTNVDKAEEDFETASLINVKGTENIAKAAAQADAVLLYISTDYVFDGKANKPYEPEDETNPLNNYGLTKLQGEEEVKKYCKKYYIIRTSWLYGHHGKNFVETMIELAKKMPEIKVVDDQIGCPTWTTALSGGIVDLIEEEEDFGTYHICGSGKTTWYGFANEIFRLANLNVKTIPISSEEFPRPAVRPKYSVMNNEKRSPDWKISLKNYMELRDDD